MADHVGAGIGGGRVGGAAHRIGAADLHGRVADRLVTARAGGERGDGEEGEEAADATGERRETRPSIAVSVMPTLFRQRSRGRSRALTVRGALAPGTGDRKSTRLNSRY